MSGEVLDRLLPCLAQYLSVDHVRIYLMQEGLLTRDEYDQLLSRRNELKRVQVGGAATPIWQLKEPLSQTCYNNCVQKTALGAEGPTLQISQNYTFTNNYYDLMYVIYWTCNDLSRSTQTFFHERGNIRFAEKCLGTRLCSDGHGRV